MSEAEVEEELAEAAVVEAKFHMRDDGSLSNATAEKLALVLAEQDDVDPKKPVATGEQWVAAGGRMGNSSGKYKRMVLRNPVFRRRLEDLVSERETILADPIWGKATFMVEQGWRWAFSEGDLISALKFAEMRLRIAEKSGKTPKNSENDSENGENGTKNPVGAPATEPMNDAPAGGARARLQSMTGKAA